MINRENIQTFRNWGFVLTGVHKSKDPNKDKKPNASGLQSSLAREDGAGQLEVLKKWAPDAYKKATTKQIAAVMKHLRKKK